MTRNKKEAAEFLGVSVKALERYTSKKRLTVKYVKGQHGNEAQYDEQELERFKAELLQRNPAIVPAIIQASLPTILPDQGSVSMVSTNIEKVTSALERIADGLAIASNTQKVDQLKPSLADIVLKLTLTIEEAALFSGLPLSMVKKAIKLGQLEAVKTGRGWRVKRVNLENWIKQI